MAHITRNSARPGTRPRGGGKLALFEVLQAAQNEAPEAVAPLTQPAAPDPTPAPAPTPQVSRIAQPAAQVAPAVVREPAPVRRIDPPIRRADTTGQAGHGLPWGFILGGASAVAVLAIAFAIGRVTQETPSEALAEAQPMPEVLNVGGQHRASVPSQPAALASPRLETNTTITPSAPQPVTVTDARRTSGLNYLIVQSYHKSEEDRAIATRDALLQNGVGATIETSIPGWPNRICVVGTVGFERIRNNPDYQAYRERLDQISERYSSDRKIKKFDPQPFHWSRN